MTAFTTLRIRTGVLTVLALLVSLVGLGASQTVSSPIRYTAKAINLDPSVRLTATLVDFTVTRWSTDADRARLLGALGEAGQDKLLKTLKDLPRVGSIKTPDTLSYEIHYARRIPAADGSERVVLLTDRPIAMWEAATLSRTLDYPFMVIELRLGANGEGEGKITVASKVAVDKETGQIVLENYSTQPVRLTDVKREHD